MYYILLLSQMSKLQFCSESNYAAIFQFNSLPGKILFLSFRLGFFFGNWEKRRIFWIGNGAYIRPLVIGRKGPDYIYYPTHCSRSRSAGLCKIRICTVFHQHNENSIFINPNLVMKMSTAFYVYCIYSSAFQTRFYHGSKHYEP